MTYHAALTSSFRRASSHSMPITFGDRSSTAYFKYVQARFFLISAFEDMCPDFDDRVEQEDDPIPLHFIVSFLLFDGRQNVSTFQLMNEQLTNEASSFARLLELIYSTDSRNGDNAGLHRMLMDLLYEMSRIQRIKIEDLGGRNLFATRYLKLIAN